jgi:Na+/H+ antiporter NhaD/arsenite permease-like protein
MQKIITFIIVLFFIFLISTLPAQAADHSPVDAVTIGQTLPIWSSVPFLGMLLSIALFPLLAPQFWLDHYPKVTAFWALVLAIPFLLFFKHQASHEILHVFIIDYIPFIILLWALYTISGGILIDGEFNGKPVPNTLFLLTGTFLASWIGTTGASMLLIRPVLRANANRRYKVHTVVFFIFLISNIGGALTPLGDPPLFLGFLHGVPFFWTFRIIKPMLLVVVFVLLVYYILDSILYSREQSMSLNGNTYESTSGPARKPATTARLDNGFQKRPFRIHGLYNLILIAGVAGGILMSGLVKLGEVNILGVHTELLNLIRDSILILMGLLSLKMTPEVIREAHSFTWEPIKEVAILFAGIFMTIIPTLAMLRAGTAGAFAFLIKAVQEPSHYFWMSGGLSSFLDNAPTYLTFFNTALGNFFPGIPEQEAVHQLIAHKEVYLVAISCGAVFMGANTYIGNAPNFMVKSIAEENKIQMPHFFGYMGYSIAILIPAFILVTIIFF